MNQLDGNKPDCTHDVRQLRSLRFRFLVTLNETIERSQRLRRIWRLRREQPEEIRTGPYLPDLHPTLGALSNHR